jgi:hypothetical protein
VRIAFEGHVNGRPVRGFVADGVCHGPLIVRLRVETWCSQGVRVGLGPWSGPASLLAPRPARATLLAVLDADPAPKLDGDEVPVEALPEGAIP